MRSVALAMLVLVAPFLEQGQLAAQSPSAQCPTGVVSDIFIDNHSIFDPVSLPEDRWIRGAYRVANRIHVRTRPRFIERELLIQRGDCLDPRLLRESARVLREFRFIAAADVFSVPQPDGTQHLVVETRDEWTTKISAELEFRDGGLAFGGGALTEENFLGRGITLSVHALERDARRDAGVRLELPRLFGTGWGFEGSGGTTRVGTHWSQAIVHPFSGEFGTFALRQGVGRRSSLFSWVVPPDPEHPDDRRPRHLVVPLEVAHAELTVARRWGQPGSLYVLGGGLSAERVETGGIDEVEWVLDRDFANPMTPPPPLAGSVAPQLGSRALARAHLLVGLRQFEFETRSALDALAGVQDVPVGREILFTVAPSWAGPYRGDVHIRGDLFAGRARPGWVGQLHVSAEGRAPGAREPRREGSTDVGAFRHLLGEAHGFLYLFPTFPLPQTVVLRGTVQGGRSNDEPFQLTLGGPDGVRSLREGEGPGEVRFLFTVEDRVRIPSPFPDLFDLGVTGFTDWGRIVPGTSPMAVDQGWQGAIGGGLRFGFPAGSAAVVRIDVAFPVGMNAANRSPVVIVQAREWVGILGSFRSLAMEEARRTGIQPRFPGVGRAPILR